MTSLEFLRPVLEVKFAGDIPGDLAGFASTWGNVDSYGDRVAPGAFVRSLAEHDTNGTSPAMLWSHNPDEPIGKWKSFAENAKGLAVTGALTLETRRAREARALAKDGALGLSIGFRLRDATWDGDVRVLTQIDLWEVSLVALPANNQAVLTSVKSATAADVRTAVEFERFLKNHGFANSLAKRLAVGWNSAVGRRDDDELQEQVIAAIRQSAARLTKG